MADASPLVVDAHTHAFPPEWVADRTRHCTRDRWFGELYETPSAKMIDARELIGAMDAAGVAQAVVCGWPWADPSLCQEHNDYLADACAASAGRLAWLGVVSPAAPGAAAEIERCLTHGAAGIGELNADAQGFDVANPHVLADVASVLTGAGRPLLLHASEPVGHRYPGKGTATPDRLVDFLTVYPDLTVVLAHWGGGLPFYELMPEVAAVIHNTVYDTAASTYLYRPGVFRTVLDLVGPHRVLWGSDHPVLGMGKFLDRTRRMGGIRSDERDLVMAGNARRVYRLHDTVPNGDHMGLSE
ncbi:MAG: amidohydrolase [Chloroflexota bacterium]|nr:amidohydrolase [Chloroflexota bacterium]